MKSLKKVLCLVLVALMLVAVLAACGEKEDGKKDPDPVNAKTATYDEMVAYLKAKGYIADGTTPVDINTTAGYLTTDNAGGEIVPVWADKAEDFGGLWIFWWDLNNPTDNYSIFEFAPMNSGAMVYLGGACVLEGATFNGAFAIFCKDYAQADAVIADFKALPNA